MSNTPFFIPDSSPLFSYTPCASCEAAQVWQATYAKREDGLDQTFHETSNVTAQVAFNITASSLDFITASEDDCTSTYTLNDSKPLSACTTGSTPLLYALPDGIHRVRFSPNAWDPSKPFKFLGVKGTVERESGVEIVNTTLDIGEGVGTGVRLSLKPADVWMHQTDPGSQASGAIDGLDLERTYNHSLSISKSENATAEISYNASTIYIYGTTSSSGGKVLASVDGAIAAILDFNSPWTTDRAFLFMHSSPRIASRTLKLTNIDDDAGVLALDYVVLTSERPASPAKPAAKLSTPAIIGIASSCGVLLLLLLLWAVVHHHQARRHKHKPFRQNASPSSPTSSFNNLVHSKGSASSQDRKSPELSSGASTYAKSFYSYHKPAQSPLSTKSPLRSLFSASPTSPTTPYDPEEAARVKMNTLQKLIGTTARPALALRRSALSSRRGTQSSFGDILSPSTPCSDVIAIQDTAVRAFRAEAHLVARVAPGPPPSRRLTPVSVKPYSQPRPRRNISIKSAKSAKSFWSNLLSNSLDGAPPLPAAAAAQPESGTFARDRYLPTAGTSGDIIIELHEDKHLAY